MGQRGSPWSSRSASHDELCMPGLSTFGMSWEPWLWNILLLPGLSCGNILKPQICVVRDPQTSRKLPPGDADLLQARCTAHQAPSTLILELHTQKQRKDGGPLDT